MSLTKGDIEDYNLEIDLTKREIGGDICACVHVDNDTIDELIDKPGPLGEIGRAYCDGNYAAAF
jgi:hypothetical protein